MRLNVAKSNMKISAISRSKNSQTQSRGKMMDHHRFSNPEIATLLREFSQDLVCWKIGQSYGSIVYFEFGKKLTAPMEDGNAAIVGSATLVLEADEWTIMVGGEKVCDSASVTEIKLGELSPFFMGAHLVSLKYKPSLKECHILFSHNVRIRLCAEADEDICTLTFPNGLIVACNSEHGFYSDGSHSEPHALVYSSHRQTAT